MYQDQGRQSAKSDLNFAAQASRRKEQAALLREKKRGEKLEHKRQATGAGVEVQSPAASAAAAEENPFSGRPLADLAALMRSNDMREMFLATQAMRKRLAQEGEPPIAEVMALEPPVVGRLVEFLQQPDTKLQFEAAWALTNITATPAQEPTMMVVTSGGVRALVALLRSNSSNVVEQSVWALGNIAGESSEFRNHVLEEGVLDPLIDVLRSGGPERGASSIMSNATWTLSNLLRGKPQPPPMYIAKVLPLLMYLLEHEDQMVRVDALWALSFVSDASEEQIDAVQSLDGLVPKLLQMLSDPNLPYNMLCPALRTTGNFLTGFDHATDAMLRAGLLPILSRLIDSAKPNIQKECCWAISNINAGLPEQIQQVIAEGLLPKVTRALRDGEGQVKKEAMWAVVNLLDKGAMEQIHALIECGCIPALLSYTVPHPDFKGLTVALEGLNILIQKGDMIRQHANLPENPYQKQMVDEGVHDAITKLHNWAQVQPGRRDDVHRLEEVLMELQSSLEGDTAFDAGCVSGFADQPTGNIAL